MSVAADTREAVRARPFLETALRAGVVNYTAAARHLDCGEEAAVAAALRRYAEELEAYEPDERRASVSMRSGVTAVDGAEADDEGLLAVGDARFAVGGGESTAVVASGEIDATVVEPVAGRLRTVGVEVEAIAAAEGALVAVVPRRDGPDAVRAVEDAL